MASFKKTDLHIHLGGSWPLKFLERITNEEDFKTITENLSKINNKEDTDYHNTFNIFSLVNNAITSNLIVEEGVKELCDEMSRHGVVYCELRTGLKKIAQEGYENYLLAILNGIKTSCEKSCLEVKVILSLKRNSSIEIAQETLRLIQLYRDQVVGLDISDDALIGDCSGILSIVSDIHRLNIPIALHLGECVEETEEQQMRELEVFNPRRIGHGVFLCDKAKEWIFSRQLPIEMCLSSAVQAHMIHSFEEHPALQLLREGYPVAICTDDPLIFGTDHTKESLIVQSVFNEMTEEDLERIHLRSLNYKFT